jgi:hypothetical protein
MVSVVSVWPWGWIPGQARDDILTRDDPLTWDDLLTRDDLLTWNDLTARTRGIFVTPGEDPGSIGAGPISPVCA